MLCFTAQRNTKEWPQPIQVLLWTTSGCTRYMFLFIFTTVMSREKIYVFQDSVADILGSADIAMLLTNAKTYAGRAYSNNLNL